jgi:hypothetical protein
MREKKGLMRIALSICASALLVGAFLANCSSDSLTGPRTGASAGTGGRPSDLTDPVTAAPEASDASTPMAFPDPCTGESVQGTYSMHFATEPAEGGKINVHEHYQFNGNSVNSVTGLPTATKYSGSGTSLYEANPNFTNMKMETTNIRNMTINARNSATGESSDDYRLHSTEHLTIFFLPFRVTADVNNTSMDCR